MCILFRKDSVEAHLRGERVCPLEKWEWMIAFLIKVAMCKVTEVER